MKIREMTAKAIAKISMFMAKKACGAASGCGWYQPEEPTEALEKLNKNSD